MERSHRESETSRSRTCSAQRRRGLKSSRREAALERGKPTFGFFETLQSRCGDDVFGRRDHVEAHESRPVEARGRGPEGETLGGQKAMRGTTCGPRVTPPAANGPPECIQSLKSGVGVTRRESSGLRIEMQSTDNTQRQEGQAASKDAAAIGRGNPLKAEAQGRYRHETRPEGTRRNESVKRSRKPEGAAQPGEANPVQVAASFRKRRRAAKPHGSPPEDACTVPGVRSRALRTTAQEVAGRWFGDTLNAGRRAREGRECVDHALSQLTRCIPRRAEDSVAFGRA
jgi:hypothetical protein